MPTQDIDEEWRRVLAGEHPCSFRGRGVWRHLPHEPRCKLCYAPFGGPGGLVARRLGYGPWEKNPNLCGACFRSLSKGGVGGAEVEITILFADVRGSTGLAEGMSAGAFSKVMRRFYLAATAALTEEGAILDKFVGDGAIGLFVPGITGPAHARHAIAAARSLLNRIGDGTSHGAALPVGIGVHSGPAYVGAVGAGEEVRDITALGDAVNTTSRLSGVAAAGEILVSDAAAMAASLNTAGLEHRTLDLRVRTEPVGAWVLHAMQQGAAT
jgi:adenylate cyclase